ncbi:MAG: glycosyltransferase [Armatimonadota bacterium]
MSASPKPKLLFLAHLLPWPLEGGGQIKSYQALRLLKSHFDVTMLAFIRSDGEKRNVAALEPFCTGGIQTILLQHNRWRDVSAFFHAVGTGCSLVIARDRSSAMHNAVRGALASHRFAAVHVDHLQMMAFVPPSGSPAFADAKVVLDQHNIEHQILQTIAQIEPKSFSLLQWAARWDLPRLKRFEQSACQRADRVLVVSQTDADVVTELLGREAAAEKARVTPIGVDTEYFTPTKPARYPSGPMLSVGTMYWPPNVDAVQWFCAEILPLVRKDLPYARFQIVGSKPAPRVRALAAAQPESVDVTGTVPDVRPYMSGCSVFVVPLRAGSGMRVKILNAMAMGLPIVSTTLGAEGIAVTPGENILLADDPAAFAEAIKQVLTSPPFAERLGHAARDLALQRYSLNLAAQELLHVYRELGILSSDTEMAQESMTT